MAHTPVSRPEVKSELAGLTLTQEEAYQKEQEGAGVWEIAQQRTSPRRSSVQALQEVHHDQQWACRENLEIQFVLTITIFYL